MGLDSQSVKFLKYVANQRQKLGSILTIGRQAIDPLACEGSWQIELIQKNVKLNYCEEFLIKSLGATSVDSLDISNYEGATVLHDMNQPIPQKFKNRWDTVIDGGSLEHVFHVTQGLINCSLLCKPGGQIIHLVPGNNCLNHGFYQFSTDLFHQFYSLENGYQDTEVFLSETGSSGHIYKAPPPMGKRMEMMSKKRIVIMVRTRLCELKFKTENLFQKDYQIRWDDKKPTTSSSFLRDRVWRYPCLHRIARHCFEWLRDRERLIHPRNKKLEVFQI